MAPSLFFSFQLTRAQRRAFIVSEVDTEAETGEFMKDAVRAEIEAVGKLKAQALRAKYRQLFQEESRSSNRAYLFRRIAWRLQALSEGDLSARARERAAQLAVDADLRRRPPRSFSAEIEASKGVHSKSCRDPRLPPAGVELTRKHNGHTIRVKVLDDGFECTGKRYESLIAIAYRLTGTRWNGFSFFGLNKPVNR